MQKVVNQIVIQKVENRFILSVERKTVEFNRMNVVLRVIVAAPIIENLAGDIDGINKEFMTTYSIIPGSTQVFVNGLKQRLNIDYTETSSKLITFDEAPQSVEFTDNLEIIYLKG